MADNNEKLEITQLEEEKDFSEAYDVPQVEPQIIKDSENQKLVGSDFSACIEQNTNKKTYNLTLSGILGKENITQIIDRLNLQDNKSLTKLILRADKNGLVIEKNALSLLKDNGISITSLFIDNCPTLQYMNCEESASSVFSELKELKHIKVVGAFPPPLARENTPTIGCFEGMKSIKTCVYQPETEAIKDNIDTIYTISEAAFRNSSIKVLINNSPNQLEFSKNCFSLFREQSPDESFADYSVSLKDFSDKERAKISSLSKLDFEILKENINETYYLEVLNSLISQEKMNYDLNESDGLISKEEQDKRRKNIQAAIDYYEDTKFGISKLKANPEQVLNNKKGQLNVYSDSAIDCQDYSFTGNAVNFYQPSHMITNIYAREKDSNLILERIKTNFKSFKQDVYLRSKIHLSSSEAAFYDTISNIFEDFPLKDVNHGQAKAINALWQIYEQYNSINKTNIFDKALFGEEGNCRLKYDFEMLCKNLSPIMKDIKGKEENPIDGITAQNILLTSDCAVLGKHSFDYSNIKAMYTSCPHSETNVLKADNAIKDMKKEYEGKNNRIFENISKFDNYRSEINPETKNNRFSPILGYASFANNPNLENLFQDTTGSSAIMGLQDIATGKFDELDHPLVDAPLSQSTEAKFKRFFHPIRDLEENNPTFYWTFVDMTDDMKDFMKEFAMHYRHLSFPESCFWVMAFTLVGLGETIQFTYKEANLLQNKAQKEKLENEIKISEQFLKDCSSIIENNKQKELQFHLQLENDNKIKVDIEKDINVLINYESEKENLKKQFGYYKLYCEMNLKEQEEIKTHLHSLKEQYKEIVQIKEKRQQDGFNDSNLDEVLQRIKSKIELLDKNELEKSHNYWNTEQEKYLKVCIEKYKHILSLEQFHKEKLNDYEKSVNNLMSQIDNQKKVFEDNKKSLEQTKEKIAQREYEKANNIRSTITKHKPNGQIAAESIEKWDVLYSKAHPDYANKAALKKEIEPHIER